MRQAAVILPYQDRKVLMQLRDDKPEIVYPGKWGFFSGTIESGENPIQSAKRELYEEIEYTADEMFALSVDCVAVPYETILYAFFCPLMIQISEINLQEGYDFGLFTFEEIHSKRLFSTRANSHCPVINNPYIEYLLKKLYETCGELKYETKIKD